MMPWWMKEIVAVYGPWAIGWGLFLFLAWRVYADGKEGRARERAESREMITAYNDAMVEVTKAMAHQTTLFDERTKVLERLATSLIDLAARVEALDSNNPGRRR